MTVSEGVCAKVSKCESVCACVCAHLTLHTHFESKAFVLVLLVLSGSNVRPCY